MNKFLFAVLFSSFFLNACVPIGNNVNITINGNVENNSDYCGGAAPPQDLLDQLAMYHPSALQKFYVRQGNVAMPFTPVYTFFTTDSLGNYTISLPAGQYTVISEEKYLTESNPAIDSSCTYLHTPDFSLNILASQTAYTNSYTITCNYTCTGQMPQ